uniref:Uncharacterized protein n=1 Tax=Oryza brachyantha TaxID=4533 RepID=J3N857_ORYBR
MEEVMHCFTRREEGVLEDGGETGDRCSDARFSQVICVNPITVEAAAREVTGVGRDRSKNRVPEELSVLTESEGIRGVFYPDVESIESVEQEYMVQSEGTQVMNDNQEGLDDDVEIYYDN